MSIVRRTRVACAFALVALPCASYAQQPGARDTRPTVAMLYFNNSSLVRHADYEPLRKGITDILITDLSANKGIRVVERDQLQKLLEEQDLAKAGRVDPEKAVQLGKVLGAHHMLTGGFVITPKEELQIDVRSINTETSAVEYSDRIKGKAEDILDVIEALADKVNKGLHLPPMPAPPQRTPGAAKKDSTTKPQPATTGPTSKPNDFRATILLSRALEASDKKDVPGAIALYKAALEIKPDFERAKVLLASLEKSRPRGSE